MDNLMNKLFNIYSRGTLPICEDYIELLKRTNSKFDNENMEIRPLDDRNRPGGILYLKKNIPTVLIPDLHARMQYLINLLFCINQTGVTILDKLAADKIQIVCLGDGFHSETNPGRWAAALKEYKNGYTYHRNMDEEMRESLGLMEMVMELKCAFPDNFHFIKGNHENIANEYGEGNFPFRKFAYEGPMVLKYIKMFYGNEFLNHFYTFEKKLPLLVVGQNFLASHAEPVTYFDRESLINYRDNPDVTQGLTWTDNNEAEAGSVAFMLDEHLNAKGDISDFYYFSGHRPVSGLFNLRAEGRLVQLHNTQKFILTVFNDPIRLDRDISEISDQSDMILSYYNKKNAPG